MGFGKLPMDIKCSSIFGHKFEARYDEIPREYALTTFNTAVYQDGVKTAREMTLTRRYVKDVCVRCGAEVKR